MVIPLLVMVLGAEPGACSTPQHRQLDFMLGDWTVSSGGKPMGTDRVESLVGGCAIRESFAGPGGWEGFSLYRWVPEKSAWQQDWVDSKGTQLTLLGKAEGKAIVFTGVAGAAKDLQRVTYTPGEQSFTQRHEISKDGGKTWKTVFDGQFARK